MVLVSLYRDGNGEVYFGMNYTNDLLIGGMNENRCYWFWGKKFYAICRNI